MKNEIRQTMERLLEAYPAKTIAESYLKCGKIHYKTLDKDFPELWKHVLAKRYILPQYRQQDYVSQEACDYLLLDSFFGYLRGVLDLKDHVLAHVMNNFIASLSCGRPIYFLERELGVPLLRTKLPMDYRGTDIKWRWPAFRVYLPKGLLIIDREGPSSIMFLDICHVDKGMGKGIPKPINQELRDARLWGKVPILDSDFEGMSVSMFLDFDSPESCIAYAASSRLEEQSIKDILEQTHFVLESGVPSDKLDAEFQNRALSLSINLLLYLSSIPLEYEPQALRKPSLDGKHRITGLYPAKFVGASKLRPLQKSGPSIPTGAHLTSHYRAGHWKRQVHGHGRAERKLIWIGLYGTGDYRA
jgi:hypothetical protein